jgi:dihydrofolate reductase
VAAGAVGEVVSGGEVHFLRISLIAAVAKNGVIGQLGKLPWALPDDRRFFERTTRGHHVLMGRRTYQEAGAPLPDRQNVVITRQRQFAAEGCVVVHSFRAALQVAHRAGETEAFVIGGSELYRQALLVAHTLYVTRLDRRFEGDARFPEIDPVQWIEVAREYHPADERHACGFAFTTLVRRG